MTDIESYDLPRTHSLSTLRKNLVDLGNVAFCQLVELDAKLTRQGQD
jgi:hypothetical protein